MLVKNTTVHCSFSMIIITDATFDFNNVLMNVEINPQMVFVSDVRSDRTPKNEIFSIPVKPMQFIFVL